MSGVVLLFAGGTGFFANFIIGTIATHYHLINFARNVSGLYATVCIVYFLVLCRASRQPRRDSTETLVQYSIFIALLCSLLGFITPFAIQWFIKELLYIDNWIAKILK